MNKLNTLFRNLNNKQIEAINTKRKIVRVMAGAGSGKTLVLTKRIEYLIKNKLAHPSEILAITFTNKASKEMIYRLDNLNIKKNIWVMTFHVMCSRILRKHIHILNYPNNFCICDNSDQKRILKEIYDNRNITRDLLSYNQVISHISKKKINCLDCLDNNTNEQFIGQNFKISFEQIYRDYEEYLYKYKLLDFDDLLIKCLKILRDYPDIAIIYQRKFKYILVDEFQDTNFIQFELLKELYKVNKNLYVVGDPDQSIYKFRGSLDKIFLDFDKFFDNTFTIKLEENYRSTSRILNYANNLIKYNKNRVPKELYTKNSLGCEAKVINGTTTEETASLLVEEISNIGEENYKNTAILYRNNFLSRPIEKKLFEKKIPYKIYGGIKFWERKEIKDIVSYISLCLDKNDNFSFKRIINTPRRGIGNKTLKKIEDFAHKENLSLFSSLKKMQDLNKKDSVRDFLFFIDEIHEKLNNNNYGNIDNFINDIYKKSNYFLTLDENKDLEREKNIQELKNDLNEYFDKFKKPYILKELLTTYLMESSLNTNENDNNNSVNLLTIHASKGLEFDFVFIFGANEGIFPSNRSLESNDIEEERRLMYVALTRAQKQIYIALSDFYTNFTNKKSKPSTFLYESKILNKNTNNNKKNNIDVSICSENTNYKVGDKIQHRIYGEGLVLGIEDKILRIIFLRDKKIKKILSNFVIKKES